MAELYTLDGSLIVLVTFVIFIFRPLTMELLLDEVVVTLVDLLGVLVTEHLTLL